jgi:hypothetical protein
MGICDSPDIVGKRTVILFEITLEVCRVIRDCLSLRDPDVSMDKNTYHSITTLAALARARYRTLMERCHWPTRND